MSETPRESFLAKPPKIAPPIALALGAVCIPLGLIVQGGIGGGLVGGGVGLILMGLWDSARLRYMARRRSREPGSSVPLEQE